MKRFGFNRPHLFAGFFILARSNASFFISIGRTYDNNPSFHGDNRRRMRSISMKERVLFMLSTQLLEELHQILLYEYGVDLDVAQTSEIAHSLVGYFDALLLNVNAEK